jgi:hypothetical protein
MPLITTVNETTVIILSRIIDLFFKVYCGVFFQDSLYVLTMIDPDAPSNANPTFRSWLHFMAINIKVY